MKCPNCGAEVKGNVCEYCGSEIKRPDVQTCPECGGQNIEFTRESGFFGVRIPASVCRDCGYEWGAKGTITPDFQMKLSFLLFGFVLCFPIPATYLLWKAQKLSKKTKYILIGLVWAIYIGIFILPQLTFFLF